MTKALIFAGQGGNPRLEALFRKTLPQVEFDTAATLEEAEAKLEEAEIFLCWALARDIFAGARRLRWVAGLGTGVNGIVDAPSLSSEVIITATRGIHGAPMSEAAFLSMLALSRKFVAAVHAQDRREWLRQPPSLLAGKTVGILGTGLIAQAFAPRCKAFGMTTIGFSATPRPIDGFDEVLAREALVQAAPRLDFLVLMAPLEPATHGIIGERVIGAMKPTAFLVNLARGAIIDDAALIPALAEGRIGGAALDTFQEEPLAPDHPYWSTPNTIVTAHTGGFNDESGPKTVAQFARNLGHYLAGQPERMLNRERKR